MLRWVFVWMTRLHAGGRARVARPPPLARSRSAHPPSHHERQLLHSPGLEPFCRGRVPTAGAGRPHY